MRRDPGWTVLLIGGGGAVGKTYAAPRVASRFRASVLPTDDVRLILQRAIPASAKPDLHFFLTTDIEAVETAAGLRRQLAIGAFVSASLEVVVEHHIGTAQRVVIEGDAILPELAFAPGVAAVFVEETDLDAIDAALRERGRAADDSDADRRGRWAELHHAHGRALCERARRLHIAVVAARPRRTLVDRIVRASGG